MRVAKSLYQLLFSIFVVFPVLAFVVGTPSQAQNSTIEIKSSDISVIQSNTIKLDTKLTISPIPRDAQHKNRNRLG